VFFNVLDRLGVIGYITHTVIGPKLHEGLTPSDIDVLWKFYGYHGGSLVLDRLIYGQNDTQQPTCAAEVGGFIRADISATVAQKACIAVRTMRLDDPKAVRTLFRIYHHLQESEKRCRRQFTQVDAMVNFNFFNDQMNRVLDELPI
jgi:predicted anti-sigma-YlaC factor YlaD